MLKAQVAAIKAVKPGVRFSKLDDVARAVIEKAGFGDAYIHGIGHHLGMEVHDVDPNEPLKAGAVITIEPGIYLPDEKLGVRIEDDILVTKTGWKNLTASIPQNGDGCGTRHGGRRLTRTHEGQRCACIDGRVFVMMALAVVIIKLLPWWASLLIGTFAVLGLFFGVPALLKMAIIAPFKAKSAVLRDAQITVHSLEPAPTPTEETLRQCYDYDPDGDDEPDERNVDWFEDEDPAEVRERMAGRADEEDREDETSEREEMERHLAECLALNWYYLDVTIEPQPAIGHFTHWEPSELQLVSPTTVTDDWEDDDENTSLCEILSYQIDENGQFVEDETWKHEGTRRLKMYMGVKPGTDKLKFRYYFEGFGEVDVPPGGIVG